MVISLQPADHRRTHAGWADHRVRGLGCGRTGLRHHPPLMTPSKTETDEARERRREPGRLYFSTATPSASAKTMAPGRIVAPPISTVTSVSPAPSFALLRGLLAHAWIPKSISAKASRSRTAPLMTTPDHPLRTADSAIISPIRAVAIEPS